MRKTIQRYPAEDYNMADLTGILPANAPLANPYVPFQRTGASKYNKSTAFVRGTLFPGLDLPFMGMVNDEVENPSHLMQLQALQFAIAELGLYLDTHPEDTEAADLFQNYVAISDEHRARYEAEHNALTQQGSVIDGKYTWLDGKWPWEYGANKEEM